MAVMIIMPISALRQNDVVNEKLWYQLEEEKMAMDFYNSMYEKYDLLAFKNLTKSEERHMDCIKTLLLTQSDFSSVKILTPGNYVHKDIKALYDNLESSGQASLLEALKSGAYIEEKCISDLEVLIKIADNELIQNRMYNLYEVSRCHLHLMVSHLNNRDAEYRPVILSVKEYLDCVKAPVNNTTKLPDCRSEIDDCPFLNN